MRVLWDERAWEQYLSWQTEDRKTLKRINMLIRDIQRDPFDGIGKPEPLSGNLSSWWSRRIDDANRIVYKVEGDIAVIAACKSHYSYDFMEQKKASLEDPTNRSGRAGNDTRDAYARILERLSCFSRPYSIERSLFSHTDRDEEPAGPGGIHPIGTGTGLGVDDLIGEDDVTVFEAHGLEPTFSCFIFSVLTSGFYLYAKALEGGFCNPDQYETVLVIEEANKVLTGNDTAGSASKGIGQASLAGESIFEEILDQAAGYGLYVIAITQKISMMPSSVIANCGLLFVGRLASPQDVDLAIRMIGREGRYEDRDIVKWLPASPIGWFICRSNRIMDYCDADPVLVQIRPLEKPALTNKVLEEYIAKGEDIRKRNEQLK